MNVWQLTNSHNLLVDCCSENTCPDLFYTKVFGCIAFTMAALFFYTYLPKGLDDIYFPIDFYLKTSDTQKYFSLNRQQKQFNLVFKP